VFLSAQLVYSFFTAIFSAVFYVVYSPNNLVITTCAAIDVLTGGYQPNVTAGIGIFQISILILMVVGSLNFSFHYNLLHLKLRSALTREIKLFLGIIAATTILAAFFAWMNPFDSLFHIVSMISSTGIAYIDLATTPVAAKILFIAVGLIGGCAFSMAGGIRIQRILTLFDGLRKKGNRPDREELKAALVNVVGFFLVLAILSLVFSTIGLSLLDSVFEIGSALTTNGISMGITTVMIPLGYKWLLILAMIVGRVEILVVLKAIGGTNILGMAKRLFSSLKRRTLRRTSYTISPR